MKKNNLVSPPHSLITCSKETWIIRGLVALVVLCAVMWGLTNDLLKYERQTTKQLRLKLEQEQGRMQPAL